MEKIRCEKCSTIMKVDECEILNSDVDILIANRINGRFWLHCPKCYEKVQKDTICTNLIHKWEW